MTLPTFNSEKDYGPQVHWYVICSSITIAAGVAVGFAVRRLALAVYRLGGGR
jgi:hypothetical protein